MERAPPRRGSSVSRPVSRILSWAAIHLGPALPPGSSRLPGARRVASSPLSGVAPGGVYRAGASPRRWCALTAPFHPCRRPRAAAWAVFFLLHSPSGFPAWELPSTLPFGVRTFLAATGAARLPGLQAQHIAAPRGDDAPVTRPHPMLRGGRRVRFASLIAALIL